MGTISKQETDGSNFVALQLDKAAAALAGSKNPVVIAKVDADKYTSLASKYDIEYTSLASYHAQL